MTGLLGKMREATRLTRAGRLGEATEFLQRALQGGAPEPRGDGPTIDGVAEPAVAAPAGRFLDGTFTNAAGTRPYKLFVPAAYRGQPAPLLVMLHGCTQSPDDFAAGTRMNALAEPHSCLVLYPGQTHAANAQKCWNWFQTRDQRRDAGEPSIVAGMTRAMMTEYAIDPKRVFVAGLSAGGAAAVVLGEAYPDLYAAIGVHSGLAAGAAHDIASAFSAMRHGHPGVADLAASPRAIVFHGDRDTTVHPNNAREIVAQLGGATAARARTETGTHRGRAFERTLHVDRLGRTVIENWLIRGVGHAWSGGSADGTYTDPSGPDASREMLRFFLEPE